MGTGAADSLFELVGCVPQPRIADRELLDIEQAGELAEVFGLLANETRLRIVHALARRPGLSVTELAAALELSPQAISNQLRRLSDRGVAAGRRDGSHVRYRLVDACTTNLLDLGACLVAAQPATTTP